MTFAEGAVMVPMSDEFEGFINRIVSLGRPTLELRHSRPEIPKAEYGN